MNVVENNAKISIVRQAVLEMRPMERKVFEMTCMDKMSVKDISEKLHMSRYRIWQIQAKVLIRIKAVEKNLANYQSSVERR